MSRRRARVTLPAPGGEVRVRDVSTRTSRRLRLRLPGGRRLRLVETAEGWRVEHGRGRADPPAATAGGALAPYAGEEADGGWTLRVEEMATRRGPADTADAVARGDARLADFCARHPGVHAEGPRAQSGGGWFVFIGGLAGGTWLIEYADRPEEAVDAALARAEGLTGLG